MDAIEEIIEQHSRIATALNKGELIVEYVDTTPVCAPPGCYCRRLRARLSENASDATKQAVLKMSRVK